MLSMAEYGERRVGSGATKGGSDQDDGGEDRRHRPCHNCADQLLELHKHYTLGIEVQAVVELVYNALVLEHTSAS